MKGQARSPETRRKISQALRGRVFSPEWHRKLCEARQRRIITPATCLKLSQSIVARALIGEKNPNWKGGVNKNAGGYYLKYAPGHPTANCQGYVPLHRLILEEKIGRFLSRYEIAHHIDFDKSNNAPDNLTPMALGEHLHYHRNMNHLAEHWLGG